jgi:hypothetical protein
MYDLKNCITKTFGYDNSYKNSYSFNSLGYRSHHEFEIDNNPIVVIGNSISFGIGIPYEKTYAYILEQKLKKKVYNFSIGCFLHTNDYQLDRCKKIIDIYKPSCILFQINNLNRIEYQDKTILTDDETLITNNFYNFYKNLKQVLVNINHLVMYWDDKLYTLPNKITDQFCIYNKFHLDTSINLEHVFGVKSHKIIAYKLESMIN